MTRKIDAPGDITVLDHGSITIFLPTSDAGREWVAENVASDAMRWSGGVVVEHRYIAAIVEGAINDGLDVRA